MSEEKKVLPIARQEDLIVEELPGEVLVYDLSTHRAHCLNLAAARAWELCDGNHTPATLAAALEAEFDLPAESGAAELALSQLAKASLLTEESTVRSDAGVSRRSVIRKLALAAGMASLLPSVKTVQAQSLSFIGSCTASNLCVAGVNDCAPCYVPTPAPVEVVRRQCEDFRCWQGSCRRKSETGCPS